MRLNKSASLLAAVFIAAILPAGPASAAAVPGLNDLKIVVVGTDAMGTDTFANRNREYVTFTNATTGDLDIAGVVVQDNWSHSNSGTHSCNRYEITDLPGNDSTVIAGGATVTVFNGSKWGGDRRNSNDYQLYAKSDVDCGTAGHYLNNDADTVWVTKGGTDIASKSWDWAGGYTVRP